MDLKRETHRDPVLSALSEIIFYGWPGTIKELPREMRPFWAFRESLRLEGAVIFKGKRVLIPDTMRDDILSQLHAAHQGIEKTRLLARDTVYWPKIDEHIENAIRQCSECRKYQPTNRREPLIPSEVPSKPWSTLGSDIFEVNQTYYIIISDYFSKFPVVRKSKIPVTSTAMVNFFEETCAMFGIPDEIRSDNGPQYTAYAFKSFCEQWGIRHTTSSPHFPQSNGFIENQVKYIKRSVIKCGQAKQNIHQALLHIRATPLDAKIPSPAELLMGRRVNTGLPYHATPCDDEIRQRACKRRGRLSRNTTTDTLGPNYRRCTQGKQQASSTRVRTHGRMPAL
jgi:transposase InsO family protein